MIDRKRLGLGCMGMNFDNRNRAIDTVHAALDEGITLFNTGEFYGNGASEMVLGEALRGVRRDNCFVSVKFGMLPKPEGGHYGIDVSPWHVKARLAYSLKRLNLDYIDLYEPARLDESVPLEDLLGALQELVQEGYVRHIATGSSARRCWRIGAAARCRRPYSPWKTWSTTEAWCGR